MCQNCHLTKGKNTGPKINGRKVVDRPSLEQIEMDLKELGSMLQVGKKYGVSDNAVRKWIKKYKDWEKEGIDY